MGKSFIGILVVCLSAAALGKPLKVFILAGQSNMQGHAAVRTMASLEDENAPRGLRDLMLTPEGKPKSSDRVWIASLGSSRVAKSGLLTVGYGAGGREPKIGPEFSCGLALEAAFDGPILLIKTAWGGKSLNTDFRPPGAGKYEFNEAQIRHLRDKGKDVQAAREKKAAASGVYYQFMLNYIRDVLSEPGRHVAEYNSADGYELCGFIWFQGWNDMVDSSTYPDRNQPGGYQLYSDLLAHFIRDVRKDLRSPQLPFVIGVLGVGGPTNEYGPNQKRYQKTHQNFRDAMAAPAKLPEFKGSVGLVRTENFWDMQLSKLLDKRDQIRRAANRKARDQGLEGKPKHRFVTQAEFEALTAAERSKIESSTSNAGYHYLGSARILGGIGRAFAAELVRLNRKEVGE